MAPYKKSMIIGGLCVLLASSIVGSSSVYSSGQNRTNDAAHQVAASIKERSITAPWRTSAPLCRFAFLPANALQCSSTRFRYVDSDIVEHIELASYHILPHTTHMAAADVSRGAPQYPAEYRMLEVTAYYGPLPGQPRYVTGSYAGDLELNGKGITHSGATVTVGDIAADPAVFPHGTQLDVPGYGRGVVTDTGGAITGDHIDLFMGYGYAAMQKALSFGKKHLAVRVLTP